jgi:hypothetical protein
MSTRVRGISIQHESYAKQRASHAQAAEVCSRNNEIAVELVTRHLKMRLKQHPLVRQYPNLNCMESTPIIKQMHTIIRNKDTQRADFVFFADRLIRLVVEAGLGFLPFGEKCVQTPEGYQYVGVDFARSLCGVSIIRSGEAMEGALRECCQGIKIGKILVHRGQGWAGDCAGGSDCLPPLSIPELSSMVRLPRYQASSSHWSTLGYSLSGCG